MKKILLFLSTLLFINNITYSQEAYQIEEMFLDADSWFFYEDYTEALPIFLKVNQAEPDNYNVIYKIGYCYLNIPGQKDKAIPYLKQATEHTTENYRENTYIEKRAPVDAFFYLGNAYLINNQIELAIDSYLGFKKILSQSKKLTNKDIYNIDYLNRQIDACNTAIKLRNNPVNFIAANLGNPVNTKFTEFNPVVSGDEKTLVFTTKLKFYDAIFYSKKENGAWSYPVNIMSQLGVDNKTATSCLSHDGKELYLYRDDDFDGNIYVSRLKNGVWSRIEKLGETINTKYWESHASISKDGKQLYFTSNRAGGFGDLDIYVSEKLADGTWSMPKNLGKNINSPWNENSPFITEDGKKLFFSSEGHNGMGGFDIFYSQKTKEGWSEPVNIGYPLNTTDDNLFFVPYNNGEYAYYSMFSNAGYGAQDIYKIQLTDIAKLSPIKIEAVLTLDNKTNRKHKDFIINIIDTIHFDTIAVLHPEKDLDDDQYRTPFGKDHLVYESTLQNENGVQYIISREYNTSEIFINQPKSREENELAQIDSVPEINIDKDVYSTDSDEENVKIKLSLQKGNKLFVSTFYKDNVISSEEFDIKKKEDFIYEYKPLEGESKIRFKLVDKNNNIKTQEVTVSYIPKDKDAHMQIAGKVINLRGNDKDVKIKLSLEKDSKLYVETYIDNELVNTEIFDIDKESFTYEYEPRGDKSKINFKLVDKFNNIKNEEVIISHKPISQDLATLLTGINSFNTAGFENLLNSPKLKSAKSIRELIGLIYSESAAMGLSKEQTDALIIALAISSSEKTPDFIKSLSNLASGNLKITLDSLFLNQTDFKTNLSVVQYLSANTGKKGYTQKDIVKLLSDYIAQSGYTTQGALARLNQIVKTDISALLTNLDAGAIDIVTVRDFLKHLGKRNIYTAEEMDLIYALIEGINLTIDKDKFLTKAEHKKDDIQVKSKYNSSFILLAVFGIVILIFFILFFTRKKSKKRTKRIR